MGNMASELHLTAQACIALKSAGYDTTEKVIDMITNHPEDAYGITRLGRASLDKLIKRVEELNGCS